MMRSLLALLALMIAVADGTSAGTLSAGAACDVQGRIEVTWDWNDNPFNPVNHPDWVGYDIQRRDVSNCGPFERLNSAPISREPGTHRRTWLDAPPDTATTYEYRVIPVDSLHRRVLLGTQNCEPPCTGLAWAACPAGSSPSAVGTLHDWGWALFLDPCPGSCWPSVYFSGAAEDALRPYADGVQVFALYGAIGCGSVEGCYIQVDHWIAAGCGATPTIRGT